MNELDYLKYLNSYLEDVDSGLYDSYISVNKVQTFLYDLENKQFISHNYEEYKWPRSQDLKSFYELNHAFYILPTEVMRSVNDRMGRKPRFIQLSKEKSFDIDWEEDFKMAEYIYNNL
jgi:N-acylneuraminate cytidylyltransferase